MKLSIPLAVAAGPRELDLSGNRLPSMAPLAALPCLHTLNLSGNEMCGVGVWPPGAFASLEVLDVSFNRLGAECLAQLSALHNLKELDVSGKQPGSTRTVGRTQACCGQQDSTRAQHVVSQHWSRRCSSTGYSMPQPVRSPAPLPSTDS